MKIHVITWILALAILFSGCIVHREGPYEVKEAAPYPILTKESAEHGASQAIFVDGRMEGYLLSYHLLHEVSLAPSPPSEPTLFIKGKGFENLGFITPQGKTYRFVDQETAKEVNQFDTLSSLAHFFGNPGARVVLKPLQ